MLVCVCFFIKKTLHHLFQLTTIVKKAMMNPERKRVEGFGILLKVNQVILLGEEGKRGGIIYKFKFYVSKYGEKYLHLKKQSFYSKAFRAFNRQRSRGKKKNSRSFFDSDSDAPRRTKPKKPKVTLSHFLIEITLTDQI